MSKKNRKVFSTRNQKYKKSIEECTNIIATSPFWIQFSSTIKVVLNGSNPSSILCYGLGNFFESIQSKYQLGLLLTIKNEFKIKNCYVYDPKFTDAERTHLAEVGCDSLSENEEGKRSLLPGTFVYMPHCPKQLLNNLLWANWNKEILASCIIVCNSIDQTVTSTLDRVLNKYAYYVQKISPYVIEKKCCDNFMYDDVFNDMALHIFPDEKLKELENIFWERSKEPLYDNDELEFITKFECMSFQS
ncbi:SRR1-like protein isoform X1 [Rhopalosiphum maidis]|uniref:SRR1-like protein isoform X1 n=1 Tax=Rhopalosiphum maidis TaxID=43146 RepID=UPI000EFDD15F|nr:SRR1-like protein isoform X1 [Rhopalosiphum maidis]